MLKIVIYTSDHCPYCSMAKDLLKSKNLSYKELNVTYDEKLKTDLIRKSRGLRTVPQVFINEEHVGGYDKLSEWNINGKLDKIVETSNV